ncbi:MAG: DUF285 domain-containing protein [Muribaculaceae bacterium]|nr:DUF285 domain-containing protein [Muribaculaceae bacterium]
MRNNFLLAIVAMLLFASGLTAGTPYAVYCSGDHSFHLLVSDIELTAGGTLESNGETITNIWEVDLNQGQEDRSDPTQTDVPSWNKSQGLGLQDVTSAVFEETFKSTQPNSCSWWFANFKNLKEIEGLQFLDTAKVKYMDYMFTGCSGLTSIDLSSFNTANVISINGMFTHCSGLTLIDFCNLNTDNATNMMYMFSGCPGLRTVIFGEEFNDFEKINDNFEQNALIFLNDDTTIPEDRVNVVVGNKCKHLILNYGGNNQLYWMSPRNFTADKVTINRVFTKDTPATLYLPFAMDAAQYGTFYTNGKLNAAGNTVTFDEVTDSQTTPDTPYMFIPNQDFTEGITIEGPIAVTNLTGETEEAGLQGVFEKKEFTAEEAAQKIYYGWANGEFLWAEEGAKVDACRAYFRLPARAAAKAPARIKAKFGDDATGVTEIDTEEGNADLYNLNGLRVGEGYRGIVVRKGAKAATISR